MLSWGRCADAERCANAEKPSFLARRTALSLLSTAFSGGRSLRNEVVPELRQTVDDNGSD
jgi:hypothetical protein